MPRSMDPPGGPASVNPLQSFHRNAGLTGWLMLGSAVAWPPFGLPGTKCRCSFGARGRDGFYGLRLERLSAALLDELALELDSLVHIGGKLVRRCERDALASGFIGHHILLRLRALRQTAFERGWCGRAFRTIPLALRTWLLLGCGWGRRLLGIADGANAQQQE
jgi:hypothetical protein